MKTLDSFIKNIEIYNSLPESVQGDVHDLAPLFRTHLASILQECKVENPGFYGDARHWNFEADVHHPDLRDNESVVFGIEFDRETSTASTWAYVQKDGGQEEDTYVSLPGNTDPRNAICNSILDYKELMEKDNRTPGECARLQVTNVQVYPFKEGPSMGHMRALASVVLNDQFLVRGLRVMEGENGLFVCYPLDPYFKGDGGRSVCFPMARALREHIESVVLERYNEVK